jgi:hypothetical protein
MFEIARTIGCISAILLILAVMAWAKLFGGPELQRLNGREALNVGNVEIASQLLMLSAGLATVAAMLAVVAWIAP